MQPPAPVATPFTAQMVGCGISCIERISWAPNSAARRRISMVAAGRELGGADRSAPTEKSRPSARKITTRVCSSCPNSRLTRSNSCIISAFTALRRSARFRVTVAMCPSRATSMTAKLCSCCFVVGGACPRSGAESGVDLIQLA